MKTAYPLRGPVKAAKRRTPLRWVLVPLGSLAKYYTLIVFSHLVTTGWQAYQNGKRGPSRFTESERMGLK